jgi:hypothetical protein
VFVLSINIVVEQATHLNFLCRDSYPLVVSCFRQTGSVFSQKQMDAFRVELRTVRTNANPLFAVCCIKPLLVEIRKTGVQCTMLFDIV